VSRQEVERQYIFLLLLTFMALPDVVTGGIEEKLGSDFKPWHEKR
jgi:hypothetical protein